MKTSNFLFGSKRLWLLATVARMIVVLIAGIMIWVAYAHAEADASAVLPLIGTLVLAGIIAVDIRLSIKRWNLK